MYKENSKMNKHEGFQWILVFLLFHFYARQTIRTEYNRETNIEKYKCFWHVSQCVMYSIHDTRDVCTQNKTRITHYIGLKSHSLCSFHEMNAKIKNKNTPTLYFVTPNICIPYNVHSCGPSAQHICHAREEEKEEENNIQKIESETLYFHVNCVNCKVYI